MKDIIKKYDLNYKSKRGKTYNFSIYSLAIFLRDIHEVHLSIVKADNKLSNFANELKNFNEGIKTLEKKYFLNNLGLLFSTIEKVLNSLRSRLFLAKTLDIIKTRQPQKAATKPEVAAEPRKAT